jgi:hypothetical protein
MEADMNAKLGPIKIGIIITTLITALMHLGLSILLLSGSEYQTLGVLFILNGLGYLALLAAYFLPQPVFKRYRGLTRWLLAGFAAVTIIAWFVMNGDFSDPASLITKAAELILIVLLLLDRPQA